MTTGCRLGEILALKKDDVLEDRLLINYAWSFADGMKKPKMGWNRDERILNIAGLAPGTVCYFYITGDTVSIPDGHSIQFKIAEL